MATTATSQWTPFAAGAPAAVRSAPRLFEPARHPADGRTLEDVVLAAWEELIGRGRAECPICAGALNADGDCADCGSELS